MKRRHTGPRMRGRCVTRGGLIRRKHPPPEAGGRSRKDAVRAGSVTQWELRRNLEDRWLPGMSLTTSAGMGPAWRGLARAAAINRHPGASLCPRHPAPVTGTWRRAGARGIGARTAGTAPGAATARADQPPAGGAQAGATFVGHGVGEQAYVAQRPCRLPGRAVELAAGAGCAVGAQPRDFQRPGAARPGGRQWPRRGSGRCRSA